MAEAKHPIAYTRSEAAAVLGMSVEAFMRLSPPARYPNSKPIFLHDELFAWAKQFPQYPTK